MATIHETIELRLPDNTQGEILPGDVRDVLHDMVSQQQAAQQVLPLTAPRTGAYTFDLADAGCLVAVTSASAVVVTVPANSAAAFALGTVLTVRQRGAGLVSLVAASGVVLNYNSSAGLKTAGQYTDVFLHKMDTDTWDVTGGVS